MTGIDRHWRHVLLTGVLCSLWGCGGNPVDAPDDPPVPVAVHEEPDSAGEADSADPTEAVISGFRFHVPSGWRRTELTPAQQGFIDARFEIPASGDDVKLTLSTIGGGVQANIERWQGQFRMAPGVSPASETVDVDGITVTLVDLRGEFQGMNQAAQPGWRMLGAAFEGQPRDFYIKLTGPESEIASLHDQFREFVTTARRTER